MEEVEQTRIQMYMDQLARTRLGQNVRRFWKNKVVPYSHKGFQKTKQVVWVLSTAVIVVLVPLGVENLLEGEAQAQYLATQLQNQDSGPNPDVEYRPY